ncbi:unnamed protein product [Closterium sp. Naga37s-1]|nr:unnamed protein product [Closterium sp. Naga37s-1]
MARLGGARVTSPLLLLFLATLLPLLAAPVTATFFSAPTFPDFSFDALKNLVAGKKLPAGQLRAKSSPRVNNLAQSCGYFSDAPYFSNGLTALLPSNLYKKGDTCGTCYAVECAGGDSCKEDNATVTVRVVGSVGWFTLHRGPVLSTQAWDRIASSRDGRGVQVKFKRTNCKSPSGMVVRVRTGSNKNRFRLQLLGTKGPGAVRLVEVSVDGSKWTALKRERRTTTWQLLHHKDIARSGKPISVRVTTDKTGQKVVLDKIIPAKWTPSNTYGPSLTNFDEMPASVESPKPSIAKRTDEASSTEGAPSAKPVGEKQSSSEDIKELAVPSATPQADSNAPVESDSSASGPRIAFEEDEAEEESEWGEDEEENGGRSLAEKEDAADEMEDGWALGDAGWGDDEAQREADAEERAEGRSLAEEGESAAEEMQGEMAEEGEEEERRMLAEGDWVDENEASDEGEESEEGRMLAEGEEVVEDEVDEDDGRVLAEVEAVGEEAGGMDDVDEEEDDEVDEILMSRKLQDEEEGIELPRKLADDNEENKNEEKKEVKKPGPINPLKVVRNWWRFSAGERRSVARYHMLKGVFGKRKLRNAARFTKFPTYEGGKVTKLSGKLLPSVILKGGSDILPVVVVFPNFYVTKHFALHIISSSLTPGDV